MDEINKAAFLNGYLMGKRILKHLAKLPVEYIYNNTRISHRLPDWDEITFPYAHIFAYGRNSIDYVLVVSAKPFEYSYNQGYAYAHFIAGEYVTYKRAHYKEETGWGEVENGAYSDQFINTALGFMLIDEGMTIWSNHDILVSEDKTLYLQASEPVPVYE